MAHYPTTFETSFEPIALDRDLGERGNDAIASLARHGFVVATGVHEAHLDDLAGMAAEPHIVEYCPSDQEKFVSRESIAVWLGKGGGRGMVAICATLHDGPLLQRDIEDIAAEEVEMVAYGWSGYKPNGHIPGADITTAYRVGSRGRELAYDCRRGPEDRFKLGRPLGELVVATAVEVYGAERGQLSLETWESNKAAVELYRDMGFVQPAGVEAVPSIRPTLRQPGEVINGQVVYRYNDEGPALVRDNRLNMRLADPVL